MELTSTERGFLEQNIEGELSDYQKYMAQAQQATNPQLARLWQMMAQDERRHVERQRAILEMAGEAAPVPPAAAVPVSPAAAVPVPPAAAVPVSPATVVPGPGFEWRGAPWPGPTAGGVPRPGPVVLPRPAARPMPWPGPAPGFVPAPMPGSAAWREMQPRGGCGCGGDPR